MRRTAADAPTSIFDHAPGEYLNCRVIGEGPRQVVLLHGFAASMHTWDDLVPLFPAEEFTLHLLDLKGHGGSCMGELRRLPQHEDSGTGGKQVSGKCCFFASKYLKLLQIGLVMPESDSF